MRGTPAGGVAAENAVGDGETADFSLSSRSWNQKFRYRTILPKCVAEDGVASEPFSDTKNREKYWETT
jgi:hypothetical protein